MGTRIQLMVSGSVRYCDSWSVQLNRTLRNPFVRQRKTAVCEDSCCRPFNSPTVMDRNVTGLSAGLH
uniref:Uncharacterized protein n=1 Tax=Faecalibaculum rodentium TaxID=1702221 RepID=A0A140DWI4_9FIRM|nr:hypothetical protein AALO17_18770 [Faecalibaculum rodentium]